jgi:hypothetical protein
MAIVQVKTEGIPDEDIRKEKKQLADFIEARKISGLVISSMMMQEYSGVSNDSPVDIPCSTIWGSSYVHEKLLNQQFRISPHAVRGTASRTEAKRAWNVDPQLRLFQ